MSNNFFPGTNVVISNTLSSLCCYQGHIGVQGPFGARGAVGPSGEPGILGPVGPKGVDGGVVRNPEH